MKLKLWQWEYDFDKEDAEIVIPLILLFLGLSFTSFRKELLLGGAAIYYLLYFFLQQSLVALGKAVSQAWRSTWRWVHFRCPYCRSSAVFCRGIRDTIRMNNEPFIFVITVVQA